MTKLSDTEVEFYVALGRNMVRARKLGFLSQVTVARMLNVSIQQIHKWETGKLRINSSDFVRFAQTTCVSIDFLLDDTRGLAERARLSREMPYVLRRIGDRARLAKAA
jgi:transcriptional regulator with XRE-family HTH domain